MPSVLGNSAATFTAFVYMMLCVGSQPSSMNAPVALLLPNGAIVMNPNRNSNGGMEMFNKNYLHDQSANPCLVHSTPTYAGPNEGNDIVDRQYGQPRIQDQEQLSDPFKIDISSGECKQLGNSQMYNPRKVFPNSYETDVDINTACSLTNQSCTATTNKVSSTIPKSKIDVSRRITGGVEDSRRTTWDLISNTGYSKFDRLTKLNRTDVQIRKLKSAGGLYQSAGEGEMCCTRTWVRPKPSERESDCSIHANYDKHLSKGSISSTKPIPPVWMHSKDLSSKRCSCEDVSNEVWAQNKTEDSNMMYKRHSKNVQQQIGRSEVSNDEITTIHNRREYAGFVQSGQNHRGCNCIDRMISDSVGVPSGESVTAPQNQWPRRSITDARSRFVSKGKGNQRGEFERHDCYSDVTNQNRNALNRVSSCFETSGTNIDGVQYFDRRAMGIGSTTDLKDTGQRLSTCDRDSFRNMGRFTHENNGVENYRFPNAKCVLEPKVDGMWPKEQPQPARFHSDPLSYRGEYMNDGKPLRNLGNTRRGAHRTRMGGSCEKGYSNLNCNWENTGALTERTIVPHLLTNENSEWCNHQLEYKRGRFLANVLPILNSAHLGQFNNISPHLVQNNVPVESAGRYEPLEGLPCFLNQHCERRGLGDQIMFCVRNNGLTRPQPLIRSPCSSNSGIHRLPWMASLIHHSPMATNNRRGCSFLPPDSLPLVSLASFVKDQDNFWWLIHYETVL